MGMRKASRSRRDDKISLLGLFRIHVISCPDCVFLEFKILGA